MSTISQTEGVPLAYPDAPTGLSTAAAALDADMLWQRIEAYIAWRFSERAIEWIVEGPGDWAPPLKPATISTTEVWNGTAWEDVTLDASPLGGYTLPGCGPYRFTGTLGVDQAEVPPIVLEAWRRLAEFSAEASTASRWGTVGLRGESTQNVGSVEYGSPDWRARAMQQSGAGDLLRIYRRA